MSIQPSDGYHTHCQRNVVLKQRFKKNKIKQKKIVFTGDLGQTDVALVCDCLDYAHSKRCKLIPQGYAAAFENEERACFGARCLRAVYFLTFHRASMLCRYALRTTEIESSNYMPLRSAGKGILRRLSSQ